MDKEYPSGQAPEPLETLASQTREADGIVVVSAEYNHSIPALHPVPKVQDVFETDRTPKDPATNDRVARFLTEPDLP
jgi:hypothetical protein